MRTPSRTCLLVFASLFMLMLPACGGGGGGQPAAPVIESKFDVAYAAPEGFDPSLTSYDVYYEAGTTGRPVLIYVHGGAWATGDKAQVHEKATFFVNAGYVFASVNYRLYPGAVFPSHAVDVAAAIAAVRSAAGDYGGDAQRITLMGHSAGAHLVTLVATDPTYLALHGMALSAITAVVSLDIEAYDIPYKATLDPSGLPTLYTTIFGTDPAGWVAASPITGVMPGVGIPPMAIAYSAGNTPEQAVTRVLTAEHFVDALQGAGLHAVVIPAPTKTHAQINREFGLAGNAVTEAVTEAVMAFLAGL